MKRSEGLRIATRFSHALKAEGIPVQRVLLYGSVARDAAHEDSDLDIAVICKPFGTSRHEENMALRRIRWDIDVRIEPYCFHPEDFSDALYFPLAREIERTGVEV